MSEVTVECPFCGELFLMERPLFTGERKMTGCQSCRAQAIRNTQVGRRELVAARRAVGNPESKHLTHPQAAD